MSAETITLPLDVVLRLRKDQGDLVSLWNAFCGAVDAALWSPPEYEIPWISVEEHPHPTDRQRFLCHWYDDLISVVAADTRLAHITHWCPLPKPPKDAS